MRKEGKAENNFIQVAGELGDKFTYIYTAFGKKYYEISVKVPRLSGEIDEVITRVSESCCNTLRNIAGSYVQITGQLRVYPKEADGHKSALLRVYAKELQVIPPCAAETNQVILSGFICKPPVYRTTPLNRKITDLIVAVNRQYGKTDYVPCICWGKMALSASRKKVGDPVQIVGRMQSRKYIKRYPDHEKEMVAYEVSVVQLFDSEDKAN